MAWAQLRYAGSDTVMPIVEAAQIAFDRGHAGYKLQIQPSGTSSGLRELCTGRAAIVGASRAIKPDEVQACASAKIQYAEIPIALDAVVVVVSAKNAWLKDLTLAESRTVFDPASSGKLMSWKQVRASFPDVPRGGSAVLTTLNSVGLPTLRNKQADLIPCQPQSSDFIAASRIP